MKYSATSLVSLAILGTLASCKAPIAPASNPTLALILPDSAHAYDTLTFRAHYSDPVQPSWKYFWQFGDSTSVTTSDTGVHHTYDSAGAYTINVALEDSSNKTIAKQSGQLPVLPLNGPTLTLTVPDTVYWGDSCVLSVSSSQPLQPSWKYTWSFGDTITYSTQANRILHGYLTPGTYTVRVELSDTVRHILLGSRATTIHVVARHFDLSMLQSMKYVDVSFRAFGDTSIGGNPNSCGGPGYFRNLIVPFVWSSSGFSMSHDTSWTDSIPGYQEPASGSSGISENGTFDPSFSELTSFLQYETSEDFSGQLGPGNWFCYSRYQSDLSVSHIPFKSSSDSDMIFEAIGINQIGAYYSKIDGTSYTEYTVEYNQSWVMPTPSLVPYIIVRFHR